MDITDIKVTIKDKEILNEIEPDQLKLYLDNNGWELSEDYVRNNEVIGQVYSKYSENLQRYLRVRHIFSKDWADYSSRMAENLFEMENDGYSQLKLYCEITGNTILIMPDVDLAQIDDMIKGIVNNVVS